MKKNKDSVFAEKINPYTIESIQFTNGDLTLSGELRLPVTRGPHPVVINVHGSGKVIPDTWALGTLFFLHYGIGVLSYDKRGAGKSTGNFATAGYKDFASDVLAAIDFVKGHPNIDNSKIGLHGSSEGGWVSSIVASKSDDLAFMIIRTGSGVSGAETYIHEIKNELLDYDLTDKEYRHAIQFERKLQKMAAEDRSLDTVNSFIDQKRDETWFVKVYKEWDGIGAKRWVKMKKTGPIDLAVYLRKVTDTPVLWFLAEKDENVPYEFSKPRIKVALKEAGNKDFEIVSIPEANHAFFIPAKDGGIRYADGYWDKMVSWLKKHGIIN